MRRQNRIAHLPAQSHRHQRPPVLVNTDKTAFLHNTLPGLTQFDHVITQLTMSGKTYWVDPTITGDEFYLYLSAEGGGDRKVIEQLKRSLGTKH